MTAQTAAARSALAEPHRALRVLVVNPLARGVDRGAVARAAELLELGGRAIREVGRDGTTRALAAEAVRAGAGCVVAVGGDGTMHEVVQELAGSRAALAIVPLGTSNDLAARAGVPLDLEAACGLAVRGAVAALDVLSLDGRRIATVGGVGFPAHVARDCNALRSGRSGRAFRSFGRGIYTAVTACRILAGSGRRAAVALRFGRTAPAVQPVSAVLFGLTPRFGGGMCLFPDARLAAGRFAALILTAGSRAGLLRTLVRAKAGRPFGADARLVLDLQTLQLRTFRPLATFGDGEWLGERRRIRVTVERDALRMMVPRGPAWGLGAAAAARGAR